MLGHSRRSFISCGANGRSDAAMVIGIFLVQRDWNVWCLWILSGLVNYSPEEVLDPMRQPLVGGLGGLTVAPVDTLNLIRGDALPAPRPGKRIEAERHLVRQVVLLLANVLNL